MSTATKTKLEALTGVRFAAALLVVLFHFGSNLTAQLPPFLSSIVQHGYVAVSFFFVLSGFVLIYSYVKPDGTSRAFNGSFWWARFARIYPLYLVALLLAVPPYLAKGEFESWSEAAVSIVSSVFMVQAWHPAIADQVNGPGWSLSAEAFFYLTFPFLLPVVTRLHPAWIYPVILLLGVLAVIPVALMNASGQYPYQLMAMNPALHLPQFIIGMLGGWLFLQGGLAFQRLVKLLWIPALVIVLMVLGVMKMPYSVLNNGLLAVPFVVLLAALAGASKLNYRTPKQLVLLGEASYALYILQLPVASWFKFVTRSGAGQFSLAQLAVYLFVLIGLSIASFLYFEVPMRRMMQQFQKR